MPADLIWIQDAATEYGRSVNWFRQQVANGVLTGYQIPGDKRLYVSRAQVTALLKPSPIDRKDSQTG